MPVVFEGDGDALSSGGTAAQQTSPIYKVVSAFTASGDVQDYDSAKVAAIKSVLASAAGVGREQVSLTITAASVMITSEISVPDEATADSTSSSLATGIFASADALEAALSTGGVSGVTVAKIDQAPSAQAVLPASGGSVAIGIEVLAVAAVFAILVGLCAGYLYAKRGNGRRASRKSGSRIRLTTSSPEHTSSSRAGDTKVREVVFETELASVQPISMGDVDVRAAFDDERNLRT